ncbi:MAG: hypothetical protein PHV33_01235 [Elusimicrobiales bacterium]|nr:hypothetical protein [Elusimicrobiales bacterium]
MKNTKAIFFIILGAFIMATGFAFAKDQPAYETLMNGPFGTPVAADPLNKAILDTSGAAPVPAASAPAAAGAAAVVPPVPAPTAATTATPPKDEKKPTFTEKVGEFFGKYRRDIFRTGISAFIGFALIGGPAGLLIGAVVGFAFFYMAGMSNVGKK